MEEALYETKILSQFTQLSLERASDETVRINFRRLLEKHELTVGIMTITAPRHHRRCHAD